MKKLICLLLLLISFSACSAQRPEAETKPYTTLTVITISEDDITFQTVSGQFFVAYENPNAVRVPYNLEMEENRKYKVKYRFIDCDNCSKRRIEIIGYSIDPTQALKDGAEIQKL